MANSTSGQSVITRVVMILDTFDHNRTAQTVTEIATRARLPISTTHRIVGELITAGLLEHTTEHQVRLGLRLWKLALRGSTPLRLRQAALPHMTALQQLIKEHTQLAVLENDAALFIERLSHPQAGANIARITGRLPLHASSAGIVLLAFAEPAHQTQLLAQPLQKIGPRSLTDPGEVRALLTQVRKQDYVIATGTVEAQSTGVAVPIRDHGVVVAALSVVLPSTAATAQALRALHQARQRIEADLAS